MIFKFINIQSCKLMSRWFGFGIPRSIIFFFFLLIKRVVNVIASPSPWKICYEQFSFFSTFFSFPQTKRTRQHGFLLQEFKQKKKRFFFKYSLVFFPHVCLSFLLVLACLCFWPSLCRFKVKASACCLSLNVEQSRVGISFFQDLVYQRKKERKKERKR